jgi:branched-chain amino acid transport system substrate-binding protein
LAIDEINSWGGINGSKLELIIEDSKTNPEEGKEAFKRIELKHQPLLYVSVLSSVSMAFASLPAENEVVLFGLLVSAPKFTQKNEWVFKYSPSPDVAVPTILSILQDLKVKRLGMLHLNDAYGQSFFELIKKGFEKTGGIVRNETFNLNSSDFKAQIVKLKDTEAIYSVGYPSHLKNVFKQLKEANYQGFILGETTATNYIVRSIPEANGVYVSTPIIYNPNFLFAKKISQEYNAIYNNPFSYEAAIGYDFIKIFAGLIEGQEISRKNIKHILDQGFMYSGVMGNQELEPGEQEINIPLYPAQIQDSKIKFLRDLK